LLGKISAQKSFIQLFLKLLARGRKFRKMIKTLKERPNGKKSSRLFLVLLDPTYEQNMSPNGWYHSETFPRVFKEPTRFKSTFFVKKASRQNVSRKPRWQFMCRRKSRIYKLIQNILYVSVNKLKRVRKYHQFDPQLHETISCRTISISTEDFQHNYKR
jgi:hypothetical protein